MHRNAHPRPLGIHFHILWYRPKDVNRPSLASHPAPTTKNAAISGPLLGHKKHDSPQAEDQLQQYRAGLGACRCGAPYLRRVGAAARRSGVAAHAQRACVCGSCVHADADARDRCLSCFCHVLLSLRRQERRAS